MGVSSISQVRVGLTSQAQSIKIFWHSFHCGAAYSAAAVGFNDYEIHCWADAQ